MKFAVNLGRSGRASFKLLLHEILLIFRKERHFVGPGTEVVKLDQLHRIISGIKYALVVRVFFQN